MRACSILAGTWVIAAVTVAVLHAPAYSAEYDVKMLNKGEAGIMVFEPAFLRLQPGDTVTFLPVDKGHKAESIAGMLPEGAEMFAGDLNKEVSVTFDLPGVYGVKCKPHFPLGMVALFAVGEPVNLDAAKAVKHTGRAKQRFADLFEQLATELDGS